VTRDAPSPILLGVLHDYGTPDGDADFEAAVRAGLDASGLDRAVELVHEHAEGLPRGSAHAVATAFAALVDRGVVGILGPAITDNALVVRDLADAAGVPCINYTGGEDTRSEWMFHYQIGSLEEEPAVLVRHLVARGLTRVAMVHDRSAIGNRYAEFFQAAADTAGVEVVGRTGVAPVAEDLTGAVATLAATGADALVYLGLGLTAHALAVARAARGWEAPVVANSALMFGYANPAWAAEWEGWTYVDAIAADNRVRRGLVERFGAAAGIGPAAPGRHDLGRLVGEGLARAEHLSRAGLRAGLERVKQVPAATGREGTTMGFGRWDRAALKGEFLVLRRWEGGRSVELGGEGP
jgi:ABC-type branched-subunit amino acid transport system substrate-binding protein